VLNTLVEGEPHKLVCCGGLDMPAAIKPSASEVDRVVKQHQADRQADHAGVHAAYEAHQSMAERRRGVVDPTTGEASACPRVAFPARPGKIGRMRRREGIARRPDLVDAVATRAVRNAAVATCAGETMEARAKVSHDANRKVVLGGNSNGLVATGAGLAGEA
jgi:hypothetical protein